MSLNEIISLYKVKKFIGGKESCKKNLNGSAIKGGGGVKGLFLMAVP